MGSCPVAARHLADAAGDELVVAGEPVLLGQIQSWRLLGPFGGESRVQLERAPLRTTGARLASRDQAVPRLAPRRPCSAPFRPMSTTRCGLDLRCIWLVPLVALLVAVPAGARETRLHVVQKVRLLVPNDSFRREFCRVWLTIPDKLRAAATAGPLRAADVVASCTMSGANCRADFPTSCGRIGRVTIDVPDTYSSSSGAAPTRCPPPDVTKNFDCHTSATEEGAASVFVDGGSNDECKKNDIITMFGHSAKVARVDDSTRWITVEKCTCDELEKKRKRKRR